MKLLVLDGNSIVNRAFYGIKLLTTHDGSYTNAIYGFLNILAKLLADETPDEVAIAFDLKAPTFRHKMYDQYKGTRKGMPQELADQLPALKELLAALGFVMVSREGWEADDILGTLAAACTARGDECRIATGDRDSLQLAAPGVAILLASTKMGRSETVVMDEAAVREKYGVEPKQLIEVKALMGDTSDNIPGVAGIGEKTALALISAFGSLDGVYANLEDSRIKPGQRKKLAEHEAEARMSRTLAEIDCHAPIETAPGTYKRSEGDPAAAAAILNRLEMPSMLEKFGVKAAAAAPAADLPQRPAQPMEGHQPAGDCLVLPAAGQNWLVVDAEGVWLPDTAQLAALLARQDIALRVFDAKPLYKLALEQGSRCRNITFDAKLAAYLLNPLASGYTVERLAGEYQIQPAFLCPDQPDAGVAAGLFDALDTGCKEAGMDKLLGEMELPLAGVLAGMEEDGILVDKEGLAAFGEQLRDRLGQLLAEIYNQVGYEFNLNSPKQLGEALFGKLGLPPRKKTKSGYSTDADTLESLRAYHPVIDNILEYRIYQKLNSTYAEGLLKVIGPDGRIHSTFSQTETRTGRISSNEPNLQNIPIRTELGSRLRQYFVARPGWVFLDADYSQIELRIMAHISGDEAMREAFRQGADIHRATASRLYQLPPEEVTPRMRSSVKGRKLRHPLRQGGFQPQPGPGGVGEGSRRLHQSLSGRLPQGEGIYGQHRGRGHGKGLCHHPLRPPPDAAGAVQLQPQPPGPGRADGPEYPHPGHRRRHHQAGHGPGGKPIGKRGPGRPADPPGPRRTDRGMPRIRGRAGRPAAQGGDGRRRQPVGAPHRRREPGQKLAGGPLIWTSL